MSRNRVLLSFGNIQGKESAYLSEVGSREGPVPVTATRTHTTKLKLLSSFVKIE
jgi:hypothetical protein